MRKMKGIANILMFVLLAAAAIGIVAVSGENLIGRASMFFPIGSVDVGECQAKEGDMVIPLVGYYNCEKIGTGRRFIHEVMWGTVTCGDDEYTEQCVFKFSNPASATWFVFDVPTRLRYCIDYMSTPSTNCKTVEVDPGSTDADLKEVTIQTGQSIYFEYQVKPLFQDWVRTEDTDVRIEVEEIWDKFGLVYYSPQTGRTYPPYNSRGCYVTSDMRLCVSDDGGKCQEGIWDGTGAIAPFESVNVFTGDFVDSPFSYSIVKYQGSDAYCAGTGKIYSFNTLETSDGRCYKYPASEIHDFGTCCPDQTGFGGKYCNDDFKWITPDAGTCVECITDFQCEGQGSWITDFSDSTRKTMFRESCIDGCCEAETKKSECASNYACPTDQVCVIEPNTGEGECMTQEATVDLPERMVTGEESGDFRSDPLGAILNFLVVWLVGSVVAGVLLFTGALILPVPFLKTVVFRNFPYLMVASLGLGALLAFVFAVPVIGSIAASIY